MVTRILLAVAPRLPALDPNGSKVVLLSEAGGKGIVDIAAGNGGRTIFFSDGPNIMVATTTQDPRHGARPMHIHTRHTYSLRHTAMHTHCDTLRYIHAAIHIHTPRHTHIHSRRHTRTYTHIHSLRHSHRPTRRPCTYTLQHTATHTCPHTHMHAHKTNNAHVHPYPHMHAHVHPYTHMKYHEISSIPSVLHVLNHESTSCTEPRVYFMY